MPSPLRERARERVYRLRRCVKAKSGFRASGDIKAVNSTEAIQPPFDKLRANDPFKTWIPAFTGMTNGGWCAERTLLLRFGDLLVMPPEHDFQVVDHFNGAAPADHVLGHEH